MCRIYGYFGKQKIPPETVERTALAQLNGGPDSRSFVVEENFSLGNNRLAIQGLNSGKQPFYSNNIYAVYNGEIYNHRSLKQSLSKIGYDFIDDCDGSVIIPLYETYGKDFVKYLDGMFCIAIIDKHPIKPILFLANDQLAIKSVYFHFDYSTDTFYFSSELKPLFTFPIHKVIRPEAVNEYLIGRTLWYGKTFYEDIFELTPSTIITKELGAAPNTYIYESLIKKQYDGKSSLTLASNQLHALVDDEVKQMLQADVPICLVTSGGLDSSYLTAIAKKHVSDLTCFNIAYTGEWPADERVYAKELADLYHIKYHQVLIEEQEFPGLLEKTIQHLGQPNAAPHALSTYALFKAINQSGFKAAIAGEGADELFSGYERFQKAAVSKEDHWIDPYFDTMCATTKVMRDSIYSNDYHAYLSAHHQPLKKAQERIFQKEIDLKSRLQALLQFDQIERFPSYILRRVDHLAMANSVEVRVPFCQPSILSYARSLPDEFLADETAVKKILYHASQSILPKSIITRPKQPFTLPIIAMLKKGHILFDVLYGTLTSTRFVSRDFFNNQKIHALIARQLNSPDGKSANFLWSLMVFELWLQHIESNLKLKDEIYEL